MTRDKITPIIFCDSLVVFQIPTFFFSPVNDSAFKAEPYYKYFVCQNRYNKGSVFGIMFDEKNSRYNNKLASADSVLKNALHKNFPWDSALLDFRLYKREYNNDKTELKEIYLPKDAAKIEEDTMRLYFNKGYDKYNYSFSKKLDSVHDMKLRKIHYEYLAGYSKKYKTFVPHRDIIFEMRNNTIEVDSEKILYYINKYKEAMTNGRNK